MAAGGGSTPALGQSGRSAGMQVFSQMLRVNDEEGENKLWRALEIKE